MKRTVQELADALAIEEPAARGLVKFLLAMNPPMARFRGQRPVGRGKGASVYEIEPGAGVMVRRALERVES